MIYLLKKEVPDNKMSIHHKFNKVRLNYNLHKVLHNGDYYKEVNFVIQKADKKGKSVYDFFIHLGFDKSDYDLFEQKRKAEAVIYDGVQFE